MRKLIALSILAAAFIVLRLNDVSLVQRGMMATAVVLFSVISFISMNRHEGGRWLIVIPPMTLIALLICREMGVFMINYVAIWVIFGIVSVCAFGYYELRGKS